MADSAASAAAQPESSSAAGSGGGGCARPEKPNTTNTLGKMFGFKKKSPAPPLRDVVIPLVAHTGSVAPHDAALDTVTR
ncbi:unnamed protein product [Closterium sp. NIES-64]|nr:unnamed protein product [Closterium sp. NIES-64]